MSAPVQLRIEKRTGHLLNYMLSDGRNQKICDTKATGRGIEFRDWRERPYAWVDISRDLHVFIRFAEKDIPIALDSWLVKKGRELMFDRFQREVTIKGDEYTWGHGEAELIVSVFTLGRGHL